MCLYPLVSSSLLSNLPLAFLPEKDKASLAAILMCFMQPCQNLCWRNSCWSWASDWKATKTHYWSLDKLWISTAATQNCWQLASVLKQSDWFPFAFKYKCMQSISRSFPDQVHNWMLFIALLVTKLHSHQWEELLGLAYLIKEVNL